MKKKEEAVRPAPHKLISDERYAQIAGAIGVKLTDKRAIYGIIDAYGPKAVMLGYEIEPYAGTRVKRVMKLDDVGAFLTDEEAAAAAVENGTAIIPPEELPEDFPFERAAVWIDTPSNRAEIRKLSKKRKTG